MNILITSVGRRSYLVDYFKKAVGANGRVHVSNSSKNSPAFVKADASVVTPQIYDEEYIPFLLGYCLDNSINAVISVFDIDLPVLAANRKLFKENGIEIVVSDEQVVNICNDKWHTYSFLKKAGICTPETFISIEEAINALALGNISFPLIVKPRWGMGSLGIFEVESSDELKIAYEMVMRKIKNSYMIYEASKDLNNCVIIQEKINGTEYGMDIINNLYGEYQACIVKQKFSMRAGETDCAVTVDDAEIRKLGYAISTDLKHIGNLDVDVIKVNDERLFVLEMNARFGGGYPFSHVAGVDLPQAIVDWLSGKETKVNYFNVKYDIMSNKDLVMTII